VPVSADAGNATSQLRFGNSAEEANEIVMGLDALKWIRQQPSTPFAIVATQRARTETADGTQTWRWPGRLDHIVSAISPAAEL